MINIQVQNYDDLKTVMNYLGINNTYCLYYADASPSFICLVISLSSPTQIGYSASVSTPASFSTDFPNALQIGTWYVPNVIAGNWTVYTYADFKSVVNYLGISGNQGNRVLYALSGSTFYANCYTSDNIQSIRLPGISGGTPASFSADFPNAISLNVEYWT